MIANYHTHTWRCNHAEGMEAQYVENALAAGLELLGFSDHSPYIFPGDYYSTFRMELMAMEGYVSTVLGLREQYIGRIEIPLGLEMEYYPKHFGELMEALKDFPLDYLILGQHFVGNEYDAPYSARSSEDVELLKRYVAQSCDAMQTGRFTYFAHPDLVHFRGDRGRYREQMRFLCREAKGCGIPLEFNLLGLSYGKHYPNYHFWEVAAEEGNAVILGRDAHTPGALLDARTESEARKILAGLGIKPLDRAELRKPV